MRPDVDDLVIAFARRNHAFAMLLLDFGDLLLRRLDFLALLLRDDHVIDADGDASLGGFAEAKFLEAVERVHGFFMTADLVALPDQVPELGFPDDEIGEA